MAYSAIMRAMIDRSEISWAELAAYAILGVIAAAAIFIVFNRFPIM